MAGAAAGAAVGAVESVAAAAGAGLRQKISSMFAPTESTKLTAQIVATVHCTFNNVIVTVAKTDGKVLAVKSSGTESYKKAKRATSNAANDAAVAAAAKVVSQGYTVAKVNVSGPQRNRMHAIRGLVGGGLQITSIHDVTPIPHNGVRPKKPRRL